MSCEDYTKFNNVTNLGQNSLLDQLEDNLKSFLDWGFLNIGGFININIPTSGISQNPTHILKQTNDPAYSNGMVWQTIHKDLVWETGISYNGFSPINISGVTVNNISYPAPTGSGNYRYEINYPLGRVIFNSGLAAGSVVNMAHSYRWCQVHKANASPWWAELQGDLLNPSTQFNQSDKGDFNITANHRVQMPCIVIESVARSNSTPWQLGATDFIYDQDILLHIFTERSSDKNILTDIIRMQKHKTIWLYDINKIINSGINGLNYKGNKNINGKIYCDIVNNENYRWNKCFFKEVSIMDMETANNSLFWCTIRLTAQVIM
jgi:hypothetical protein